jgi:Asparagine synthase
LRDLHLTIPMCMYVQNEDDQSAVINQGLASAKNGTLIRGSGVDLTLFVGCDASTKKQVVLLPARMLKDKGVLEFLAAAYQLKALVPHWQIILAGAVGYNNPSAIAQADLQRWQKEGVLRWMGHVENVLPLYKEASIVCLPHYREDMPKVLLGPVQGMLPGSLRQANPGDKLHKVAGVLASGSVDALYLALVSHWGDLASVVIGGTEPPTLLTGKAPVLDGLDDTQRMMALDALTYLPDDILVKVDLAAMSVSLEGRVPFLDHRVVKFAWILPQSLKLSDGVSKWILRQVLYRHVPKELIERPKMGFGVTIGDWLRGPLRDWAEDLLDEARLQREGYFHPSSIPQKCVEHLSGARNWQHQLWNVLMFQAWLAEQ